LKRTQEGESRRETSLLGESGPEGIELSESLLGVDGLDGLGETDDDLRKGEGKKLRTLERKDAGPGATRPRSTL